MDIRRSALLWAALLFAPFAHATPVLTNAGIDAFSAIYNCRYQFDGSCRSAGTALTTLVDLGHRTSTSASSSIVDPGRGNAYSSGRMDAASYLPVMHAYASSNGAYSPDLGNTDPTRYTGAWSAFADANVWGVQGYQYDGAEPFDLTVTATLDSIFSSDTEGGKLGHSMVRLALFDTQGYSFADPNSACPIYSSLRCIGGPAVFALAATDNFLYDTGQLTLSVSHQFHTGERFYVGAALDANACCGRTIDSSHTLRMAFNDFTNLSSIPVAGVAAAGVPEPGGIWLMLAGVAVIVVARRSR